MFKNHEKIIFIEKLYVIFFTDRKSDKMHRWSNKKWNFQKKKISPKTKNMIQTTCAKL